MYEVTVRMDDGSYRTVTQKTAPAAQPRGSGRRQRAPQQPLIQRLALRQTKPASRPLWPVPLQGRFVRATRTH